MRRTPLVIALALLAAPFGAAPALAHPHVWVTAKAELAFDGQGRITGVRHVWSFDEAYSAYVTQGLDKNGDGALAPDELQELAKVNTESLVEFEYFTVLKTNGTKRAFAAPRDYGMTYEAGRATLAFTLPLEAPAEAGKIVALEVYDPSFFVSFTMAEGNDAVRLAAGPSGCAVTITRPKPLEATTQQPLSEAFFEALTASSNFGAQFANRALVACP